MGCETCHVTHKVGEKGKIEFDYHLTKATPALCLDCHDAKDAGLIKAHQGQPFATANCVQCHDPHQSSQPKLMQTFTHPPFESRSCDTCHAPAKDGKVVLTQSDSKAHLRHLSQRAGGEDREGEGAASRRAGRMHRLPQSACRHARRASCSPIRSRLAWPATASRLISSRRRTCISRHSSKVAPSATNRMAATTRTCCACKVNALCLECHGNETQPQVLRRNT